MARIFQLPKQVPIDGGAVSDGALATFYLTGTTTKTNTFTDSALTTPHANPVVASAAGVFETIYLDPDIAYKLKLEDSTTALIYTIDPVMDTLTQENIGKTLNPQTSAESSGSITPALFAPEEGEWERYTTPATDIPLVYAQMNAPRINRQNYLGADGWIHAGDPETSSFGTGAAALQTAMDLAEDLDKGVRFNGTWTVTAQTDPDSLSRTACLYLPRGVSFIGSDKRTSKLVLGSSENAQVLVFKDPAAAATFHQTVGRFVVNGARASQSSDGGGALLDFDPTASSPQYFNGFDIRIFGAKGQALNVGSDMNESTWNTIWVHTCGASGGAGANAAILFAAGDLSCTNISAGLSDSVGIAISSAGVFSNMKSWRAGEVDSTAANGSGYRVSAGPGAVTFWGWAQDCKGNGMTTFATSGNETLGDQIILHSDSCGLAGLKVGNYKRYGQYRITAKDRSGGTYTHDFAVELGGTNNNNNYIVASSDGTFPVIDTSDPKIGNNTLINANGDVTTFASADATPSVVLGTQFLSNATGVTVTRFDDCVRGQKFTIISKGATVYDTSTATRLIGSSVDITTADGDVTSWVCETGGTSSGVCRLKGFVDVSVDNSAGA